MITHVVWFGDLNYRISMAEEKTRWLVGKMDWQNLLENDQLRAERTNGGIFNGWKEGPIEFAPTYKYYPNSDKYYDSNHGRRRRKRQSAKMQTTKIIAQSTIVIV
ncbi:Type IV inositol polyphosphate 5-phosphatase 9 [Asimina triloba]